MFVFMVSSLQVRTFANTNLVALTPKKKILILLTPAKLSHESSASVCSYSGDSILQQSEDHGGVREW
jgi:hypothetical protein